MTTSGQSRPSSASRTSSGSNGVPPGRRRPKRCGGPGPGGPSARFRSWPITATKSLEPYLREMGLHLPAEGIDGTTSFPSFLPDVERSCLSDALVSVGPSGRGGTGSFVSSDGLILTNWHVAYDAVRSASIEAGTDYVEGGYVASRREEELPGPNYEVWITKSCEDVSDAIVEVVRSVDDPLERANGIRDKMQEVAGAAQERAYGARGGGGGGRNGDGGIRCDVQEMLPNESYVLFTYERLRDVRIVYVPPRSLGNFGGDVDNFEWPRHAADFALLRAYAGPNGGAAGLAAAEYSVRNVPYRPRARLRVRRDGASEGEMVFLLGFPSCTMRYAPTSRLRYIAEVAVPSTVSDLTRKVALIGRYEGDSARAALKMGTAKKRLSNEAKRSRGKAVMMRKLGLVEERAEEERELRSKSSEAAAVLSRLEQIYDEFRETNPASSALELMRGERSGSALLAAGHAVHEYLEVESRKPDGERETAYRERNLPFLLRRLGKRLGDVHLPHEAALVEDAVGKLEATGGMEGLGREVRAAVGEDVAAAVGTSTLGKLDAEALGTALECGESCGLLEDPFVRCASILWSEYESDRDRTKALLSERDALFAELLELQRKHIAEGEVFYPDCNGSLRISAGYVEGYKAADAVIHEPVTTLAGLMDKAAEARLGGSDPAVASQFACPDRLYDLLSSSSPSSGAVGAVPVCLLYSTDTVGGNSGSPVMNAEGEFVAINFDRQRQGLMNEYKWSADHSRSIGVDVRYILWLVGEYDGASHIVEEMLS